ncbi:MAG TPA: hypothetical protein VGC60_00510 [Pyrinomonadaceae bacterium]
MDRTSLGPAKDGSLAYAGNSGRFVDGYEVALLVALSTPAFKRFSGPTDH